MTTDEAKSEVKYLRGLYPTLTPEQGVFWTKEFQRFNPATARAAINRHVLIHATFVNPPGLHDLLRSEVAKGMAKTEDVRGYLKFLARSWDEIDGMIARMSAEDVDCWKELILGANPNLEWMRGKPVATTRTWRALIAQAMAEQRTVAA